MSFSLAQMQSWMQSALITPTSGNSADANKVFLSRPEFSGAQGLAVYQRSFFLRIASCMREQFPALCYALGRELFDDFVAEYIQVAPPESYTLYDLGRRFPEFLEHSRPDRDASLEDREVWIDFMIDLARFERQVFVMFDAPGQEGRAFAELQSPDEDLRLQPCFSLGRFRFPVAVYYHEVRSKRSPIFPPLGTSCVALVRKDYLTRTLLLSEPHFLFLQALETGHSIVQSLSLVSEATEVPVEAVRASWCEPGGIRQVWIEAGVFISTEQGGDRVEF